MPATDTEYAVEFALRPEVAAQLGLSETGKLRVNFPDANAAHDCLKHAQARMHELTLDLGDGRVAHLRPEAWTAVTMLTPRQIIVTPTSVAASGGTIH